MGEWREVELGDVLTLQRGFDITKREQRDGSIPVVSSSGIASFHDEARVDGPGVVIGRKGSLGTVFYLPEPFWPHDTTLWVKAFHGNDPYFCALLLKGLDLAGLDAGSSNPSLNRNHVHLLRVRVPSRRTQDRIAGVASAFDDLIEINERRIELLEDLARSLYREWFVRFRFPGHPAKSGVTTNSHELPAEWIIGELGDLAEVVVEGTDPDDAPPDTPYIGLEHIPRRRTTLRERGAIAGLASRKLRFEPGDTLFGKIRPYFHKVAWAPFSGITSSDTIVLRARPGDGLGGLVNAIASSDELVAAAVATSNGTKMPRADPKALLKHPIALPSSKQSEVLIQFENAVQGWLSMSAALVEQNRALAATRDLLLPRLVTGRLDIDDIDLGDLLPAEPA